MYATKTLILLYKKWGLNYIWWEIGDNFENWDSLKKCGIRSLQVLFS